MDKKRDYLEDEFIKNTGELAFLHTDNINPKYIKWLESELYALKQVKNNGVLDDVSQQRELLESFVDYAKGRSIRDINIDDDTILYFLEDSNCG